ncbi:MAG: peptide chain release factor N(5)-glutamine methyltransferase [Candidatus Kapaibacterium sp.]
MTFQEAIKNATQQFEQNGIADPKTNADYLAMHILGIWNKNELRKYFTKTIAEEQSAQYEVVINRRLNHEPLQHIIGETEFFGLRLFTSPAALIPRPETEILVEEALKEAANFSKNGLRILDIGTGSGAIALALASRLPDVSVIGIDISKDAIELAEKNKDRLKIKNISFEIIDIFSDETEKKFSDSIDILISNPPYISAEEFETLEPEVKLFDPRISLTDDADGLIFYRRITEISPKILTQGGKIIVEIGYNAAKQVERIFINSGVEILRIVKDLQGIERVIIAK